MWSSSSLFWDKNFLTEISIFDENWYIVLQLVLFTKILFSDSDFWRKLRFLTKIQIFWRKFRFLTNVSIFGENSFFGNHVDFGPKFEQIWIFDQNVETFQKLRNSKKSSIKFDPMPLFVGVRLLSAEQYLHPKRPK